MADTAVTIEHEELGEGRGRYIARIADSEAEAELTWHKRGENVRVADHTFVPPALRDGGIAAELVRALVADAEAQDFKVSPACSYVARYFDRHPDLAGLRA